MHLFVSPHLDDAVLSCGGLIHNLSQQSADTIILTIMAGDPPDPLPDSPLVRELHARWETGENPVALRREEDRIAAKLLGAQTATLPIPDCIYRTANGVALYPYGDDDLFGPVHPEDPARSSLTASPLPYYDRGVALYVPLGVGNHVDHQLVLSWIMQEYVTPESIILFYEDYPYSEDQSAMRQTVDNFPLALEPEFIPLTQDDLDAKCAAIAAYQSQISTFWGSLTEMRERVKQHLLTTGKGLLAERYWRLAR